MPGETSVGYVIGRIGRVNAVFAEGGEEFRRIRFFQPFAGMAVAVRQEGGAAEAADCGGLVAVVDGVGRGRTVDAALGHVPPAVVSVSELFVGDGTTAEGVAQGILQLTEMS